jgi:hypothetical protein
MRYWLKRVSNCLRRCDFLECDEHETCFDAYLESTRPKGNEVIDGKAPEVNE